MASVGASREPAGVSKHPPAHDDLEDIELSLLLEGVFRQYGFDFREYAPASLRRRVWRRVFSEGLQTISALQDKLLHDPACMERLLLDLSINVTAMFRDPSFYVAFREKVVPALRTYPFTRIWVAGCSTGEEVYSLAILLQEEQVYDRTRIYATDINESVLERARSGVFPLDKMREYTQNYIKAGGTRAFSEYYLAKFNVIICRNVMIYFDRALQDRVHRLFFESLVTFGVLGLGHKEAIRFSPHEAEFEELDPTEKLYRKIV
jgi:chemotaxis protein methyltransferase CheR